MINIDISKLDKRQIYYVYEWYDIDNKDVFYVGKGRGNRAKIKTGRNKLFNEYINTHNCTYRIIKDGLDEYSACKLEDERIKELDKIGMAFCNISKNTSARGVCYGEQNGFYGKTHSPEVIEYLKKINSDGRNKGENNSQYGISPKDRMDAETYAGWRKKQQQNKVMEKNPRASTIIRIKNDVEIEYDCILSCAIDIKKELNLSCSDDTIRSRISEGIRTGKVVFGSTYRYKDAKKKNVQIVKKNVFIEDGILKKLSDIALKNGTNSTALINEMVSSFLDKNNLDKSFAQIKIMGTPRVKTIRLKKDLWDRFEEYSRINKVSFNSFIANLVKEFIENSQMGV